MKKLTAMLPLLLLSMLAACNADDCAHRLAENLPLPAAGCCTHEGFCVWPPAYDVRCHDVPASVCEAQVRPPLSEGGPPWVFCNKQPWDETPIPNTVCPAAWIIK
jgi:hypothetical protein